MTSPQTPVLELRDVIKRFGNAPAVDGISFVVQPGEVFTLLGPSGCGKSTTLRLVAGLEQPDGGQILLGDRVVAAASRRLSLPPERRGLGMVFQSYAIWPHMTVYDNVAFPLSLRRVPRAETRARVKDVLELVGLGGLEERPATNLSGGQQQRVALARALVYEPQMLLLDEPLSNLDAKLREHMRLELKSLQRRLGVAVLFVTHDQQEAMTLSDRVAVMNRGRIEQLGTPAEVYERPATPFVRDFLGRTLILEGALRQTPDGGRRVVLTGEDTSLEFPDGVLNDVGEGEPLLVACRPEDVRLIHVGERADTANLVTAFVEQAAYLGDRQEYSVRTSGGRTLLVYGSRYTRYQAGDRLTLEIDTRGATVWRQ